MEVLRTNRDTYPSVRSVVPTRGGTDLDSGDGTKDAHIRIESYKGVGTKIFVDVFDSKVRDSSSAHLVSEMFEWTDEGANLATLFLQKHGFRVAVMIK